MVPLLAIKKLDVMMDGIYTAHSTKVKTGDKLSNNIDLISLSLRSNRNIVPPVSLPSGAALFCPCFGPWFVPGVHEWTGG